MRSGGRGLKAEFIAAAAVLTLAACTPTQTPAPDEALTPAQLEARIREATVTLLPGRCAGVLTGDGSTVVTAAHCLGLEDAELPLGLPDGTSVIAIPLAVDRGRDVAVLGLREVPAGLRPLVVEEGLPAPGETLYFAGRNDRPQGLQRAQVERLAPCPSLPGVPAALFTTLRGRPGDSGAPLVDARLRVRGLVHGGAQCRIATPLEGTALLLEDSARMLAALERDEAFGAARRGTGGSGPPQLTAPRKAPPRVPSTPMRGADLGRFQDRALPRRAP